VVKEIVFSTASYEHLTSKIVYPENAENVGEKRRMTALGEFPTSLITDSSVSYLGLQAKHSPRTDISIKS